MTTRPTVSDGPLYRAGARANTDRGFMRWVKVSAGVAAGSCRRGAGNARAESWAMFITREQFDACRADDPLRFTNPLLFAQIKTEFDHVFDQHRKSAS